MHDPDQAKACLYASSQADTPFGPYKNEHALFVWFDESRERIVKMEEMFDSAFMKEFLPSLHKYLGQQAQARAQQA